MQESSSAPSLPAQLAEDALGPYLAKVHDRALKHALEYGVAFLHETQPPAEQDAVALLFKSGAIQVCGLAWLWLWLKGSSGRGEHINTM